MPEHSAAPALRSFFDRLVRRSLGDLRLASEPVAGYIGALLARFARTDQLYALRGAAGQRLETVVDLLLEIQRAWSLDRPDADPFRERELRQQIGDYTLFMTGIFPEQVAHRATTGLYVREGKRAYRVVADFERAALKPDARLFAALSAEFESYAAALRYMRRVYLPQADAPPSVQPTLRLLTQW